jgi:hypothetical protein
MSDDDLRLNSLARYSKQSSKYILESHSHCEVPAGCGGAVLRWRNPRRTIPLLIRMYWTGQMRMTLDCETHALTSARAGVSYGDHVFTWAISGIDPSTFIFAFSATYDEGNYQIKFTPPTGQSVDIHTAPDESWRYTLTEPAESWEQPDFDDSAWPALHERAVSEEELNQNYRLRAILRDGAHALDAADTTEETHAIWIRRRFTLTYDEPKSAGN